MDGRAKLHLQGGDTPWSSDLVARVCAVRDAAAAAAAAMDGRAKLHLQGGDTPWSSDLVARVCAVRDAAAAAAAEKIRHFHAAGLDTGSGFWLQSHACFEVLQDCQLRSPEDEVDFAKVAGLSYVRRKFPQGTSLWLQQFEWNLANGMVQRAMTAARTAQKPVVTMFLECDKTACREYVLANVLLLFLLLHAYFCKFMLFANCSH